MSRKKRNNSNNENRETEIKSDSAAEEVTEEVAEAAETIGEEVGKAAETVKEEITEKVTGTAADRLKDVLADEKRSAEPETKSEDAESTEDTDAPKKKKEHKKLRHGALSTVYTVIFIAAVVMLNIVAGILFKKYPLKLDLTKSGIYSISDESVNYVKSIDTDVTIRVFAKEDNFVALNEYSKQANEVIKRITEYNNRIKAEYIDIDSNPDIVSEYTDQTVTAYSILVETVSKDRDGNVVTDEEGKPMKRIRQVSLLDLINFKSDVETQVSQYYGMSAEDYVVQTTGSELQGFLRSVQGQLIDASTADEAFVSALMTVTDPNPITACVLTGRDEVADIEYLKKLLTANGYTLKEINITSEEIPEDANICILPAPAVDYMDAEVKKLDDYVTNDGKMGHNLLYLASFNQQATPKLDEFLEEYGISVGSGLICENDKKYYYTQPFWTIAADISGSYTDGLASDAKILFFGARPVKLLQEGEHGKLTVEALIKSTTGAYIADEKSGSAIENGQQTYAAMATKVSFSDDGSNTQSHVFVTGSDRMFSSEYLRINQYQNREYAIGVINSMTGKTSSGITIEPKVITGSIFDITAEQIRLLKIVFIGVIPAITLFIGFFIWFRRKNR
ncbi:MAG: GldG family protein [Ruminococcus sp.]|nr:GldG family protein [Ruminococcus sp.]